MREAYPIEELELSVRAYNILKRMYVDDTEDLAHITANDLNEWTEANPNQAPGFAAAMEIGLAVERCKRMHGPYFIHKHEVAQSYGGPEEGGWWYETGIPVKDFIPVGPFDTRDEASEKCRELNLAERDRAEREEEYGYTSVLSYRSNHYAYSVHETTVMEPYPERRPHYE